ncbi:MAG: UDP-N-acetylmuramoyl-L-alanine--D-glutamate ligase, partial [Gammaproteobacteria bacterium]|nr:UDP-N-acetylmuramoyl-L-alanine--D-glutamate ligase [Gammaproteobacteria bacterium]
MKLVLGLGETGFSIACFLSKQAIEFKLADSRKTPPLLSQYQDKFTPLNLTLGDWTLNLLSDIDEVFISPGIAQSEPIVIWARQQNIPVTSDIELFSRYAKAPIIGITGSNGKSTVTRLLGDMIANNNKKVAVGGNIGKPALDCLSPDVDFYVLELSSYQLDYTQSLNLLAGVVLNITPDHLDRYPSFEHYVKSKLSLYQHCQTKVINSDEALVYQDPSAKHFGIDMPKQPTDFGTVTCHGSCYFLKGDDMLMAVNEMQLIGKHNVTNILAALSLGDQIGLDIAPMIECVKAFKGLEHRLEWVVKKQNIDYYNDSKATNAISTIKAIKALISRHQTINLILGGIPKDEDYSELFALIDQHITSVTLIGQSAEAFKRNIKTTPTTHAKSMQSAVEIASNANCEAVLLSPACASFD